MSPPAPTEPKSVSQILKQRQQSRSAAIAPKSGSKNAPGPSGTSVNENLNPVLPPLYPTAPKSIPLNPEVVCTVKAYNKFSQYFRSNYSVAPESKGPDGFYVDRYTDQYKSPLALKPHLVYKLPDSKFPQELSKKSGVRAKPVLTRKKPRIEDLDEDESKEESKEKSTENAEEGEDDEEKEETVNIEDNEEFEDEMDEEMDVGTDYALSYFDNGEGDEDDRDEDDGPTY